MKLKLISRIFSLLLVFALLAGAGGEYSVFAANTENSVNSSYSSQIDLRPFWVKNDDGIVKISRDDGATWTTYTPSKLEGIFDGNSDGISIGDFNMSKESLMSLADSTEVPGAGFGVGLFFDNAFGKKKDTTPEELKKIEKQVSAIQTSLNVINDKLSKIGQTLNNMFVNLQNDIVRSQLRLQISQYISDISTYEAVLYNLNEQKNEIDAEPDGAQKAEDQRKFAMNIYNKTFINGNDFCTAVQSLGIRVSQVDPSSGKDIFAIFDELALYSYKWENQGYVPRRTFQASVTSLYASLSAFAHVSLGAADAASKAPDFEQNHSGVSPKIQYSNLLKEDQTVLTMANSETVVERPSYERYYQVQGHECLLYATASDRTVDTACPDWNHLSDVIRHQTNPPLSKYDPIDPIAKEKYKNLFTDTSINYVNTNPTKEWLNSVYSDYGGSYYLCDIFFDPNEGNFFNPYIPSSKFITNTITITDNTYKITPKSFQNKITDNSFLDFQMNAVNVDILNRTYPDLVAHWYFLLNRSTNQYDSYFINPSHWIGLAVLHQGVTPVDYVPESRLPTEPRTSSDSTSDPSSESASAAGNTTPSQITSAAASNPATGDDGSDHELPLIAGLSSAAAFFALMLFRKKCSHVG